MLSYGDVGSIDEPYRYMYVNVAEGLLVGSLEAKPQELEARIYLRQCAPLLRGDRCETVVSPPSRTYTLVSWRRE